MATPQLTPNAIRQMISVVGKPTNTSTKMIVQVINIRNVTSTNGERYRVMLSDGTHYVTGMLASQLMKHSTENVQQDCIIQVDDYMCNEVSNRHVIILLGLKVLQQNVPSGRIGTPVDIEKTPFVGGSGTGTGTAASNTMTPQPLYNSTNNNNIHSTSIGMNNDTTSNKQMQDRPMSANSGSGTNPYGRLVSPQQQGQGHTNHSEPIVRSSNVPTGITPIAALNMYNNRWTIQARLTVKSDIRTWSNAKGEGCLFSVELLDSTQDIRATFFKEAVDKFYHMLTIGKVYTFTGGRLKVANMQYNNCKSPYEITFDQNSEIHLANDDGNIDKVLYDFVKISNIETMDANKVIDVLGIAKSVSEPQHLISKKTGSELIKCDVVLIDDTGYEISCTIWGEKAQNAMHEMSNNAIVAFRRARIGDYNGKSLSAGPSYEVNPNIEPAKQLQMWWNTTGQNSTISKSLSSGGSGKVDSVVDRKPISSIKQENMGLHTGAGGSADKADWITFKGTLSFLKKDKDGGAWYTACANAGEPCKNRFKCTQTTDNQWYCDKCQNTYPNPVRRWIFSGVVEDHSSSTWVSFFNEQAESLFGGVTADECYNASYLQHGGYDSDYYESLFASVLYKEFVFKCKVKNEFHNDENRIKTSVYSLTPVDYGKESNELLAAMEQFL